MSIGVYVCTHVLHHLRPVTLIVHHSDGMWQLTCGEHDHPTDRPDLHLVHSEHLVSDEPQLAFFLRDLPTGYLAEKVNGVWNKLSHDD